MSKWKLGIVILVALAARLHAGDLSHTTTTTKQREMQRISNTIEELKSDLKDARDDDNERINILNLLGCYQRQLSFLKQQLLNP